MPRPRPSVTALGRPYKYEVVKRDRTSLRQLDTENVVVSRHRKLKRARESRDRERRRRRRDVGHDGFRLDYAIRVSRRRRGMAVHHYLRDAAGDRLLNR